MNKSEDNQAKVTPIESLKAFVAEGPSWEQRLAFVTGEKRSSYSGEGKVLEPLLEGLDESNQNKLIAGLIKDEWTKAKAGGDPNTFMRSAGLAKSAMMRFMSEEIKKNPQLAEQFRNNPIELVKNIQFPSYLKEVLGEIVNEKIESKAPLYGFAHNIVFSIVSGPALSHYNEQLIAASAGGQVNFDTPFGVEYNEARAASQLLVNCNGVLKFGKESTEEQRSVAMDSILKKNITADTVVCYGEALETLMATVSDKYKTCTIAYEVMGNLKEYNEAELGIPLGGASNVEQSVQDIVPQPEKNSAKEAVLNFINTVVSKLDQLISKLASLSSSAASAVKGASEKVAEKLESAGSTAKSSISSTVDKAVEKMKGLSGNKNEANEQSVKTAKPPEWTQSKLNENAKNKAEIDPPTASNSEESKPRSSGLSR